MYFNRGNEPSGCSMSSMLCDDIYSTPLERELYSRGGMPCIGVSRMQLPYLQQMQASNMPCLPKVTYRDIEMYLANGNNVQVVRLANRPQKSKWVHACVPLGVTANTPVQIMFYDKKVEFIACPACGKIIYYCEG